MTHYYKLLTAFGYSPWVKRCEWRLPPNGETPGEWMPSVVGDLMPCENGYHVCRADQFMGFWEKCLDHVAPTSAIYLAEIGDEFEESSGFSNMPKIVARDIRLLTKLMTWEQLEYDLRFYTDDYLDMMDTYQEGFIRQYSSAEKPEGEWRGASFRGTSFNAYRVLTKKREGKYGASALFVSKMKIANDYYTDATARVLEEWAKRWKERVGYE